MIVVATTHQGSLTVESEQDFSVCSHGGLLGPREMVRAEMNTEE